MEDSKLELIFDFLKDTQQYQLESYDVLADTRDSVSLISKNLEDFVNIIKEKNKKEEEAESNGTALPDTTDVSAMVGSSTVRNSSITSNDRYLQNSGDIAFYSEYLTQTIDDMFSVYSPVLFTAAVINTDRTLTEIRDIVKKIQVQPIAQQPAQKVEEKAIAKDDSKGSTHVQDLTAYGTATATIIKAVSQVNKSYVKKVTIFSKSIDNLARTTKKNFGGADSQKIMISAGNFSTFIKNYTDTVSKIDVNRLSKSKIKKVIATFDLFHSIKATGEDVEKASAIAQTMQTFAITLQDFMKTLRRTKAPSQRKLTKITTTIRDFVVNISETLKKSNVKKSKEIAEILNGLGKGIAKFAKRMLISSPILAIAFPGMGLFKLMMKFLVPEFNYLAKNGERLRIGAKALKTLGWGVMLLSTSVFLTAKLLMNISLAKAGIAVASIIGIGYTLTQFFSFVGKFKHSVMRGIKTIAVVAAGSVAITAALYLMSITPINWKQIALTAACITGLGLMYAMLGAPVVTNFIRKGALSMGLVGLSLLSLTIPLAAMAITLHEYGDVLWKLPLFLFGTGAIFALAGLASAEIALGALSFILVGASMWSMYYPLIAIAATLSEFGDVIWKFPLFLLTTGVVYSLAGFASPLIALGAVAFALMGLSMWTMYHPLAKLGKSLHESYDDMIKFPWLLTKLGLGYAALGVLALPIFAGSAVANRIASSIEKFANAFSTISQTSVSVYEVEDFGKSIEAITKSYAAALDNISVFDLPATFTLNRLAGNLKLFSEAIGTWSAVNNGWSSSDADVLAETISGINAAMILGVSPDYIKQKYGVEVTQGQMWLGLQATMSMGKNLTKLAKGVEEWKRIKLGEDDAREIVDNIGLLLSTLPYSIAKVGKMYDSDDWTNLWGLFDHKDPEIERQKKLQYMNGEIFSLRELKLGLDWTEDIGDLLEELADNIKFWKDAKIDHTDILRINTNIETMLEALPYSIAKVGKFYDPEADATSAILASHITGKDYTRKEMEYGIEWSRGIGDVLESLANGVKYWVEAKITQPQVVAITDNVNKILTTIPSVIAQIGKTDGEIKHVGFLGLWSKTDVERGIDYTIGIGQSLTGLADGVKYWVKAELTKTQIDDIKRNVQQIITTIPSVFAEVGRSKDTDNGFWGLFTSDAEKGIEIIDKLNKPFSDLAGIIIKFNTIPEPDRRAKLIGACVKKLLKDTIEGFASLSPYKVDQFEKFMKPFEKFIDILSKLTKQTKELEKMDFSKVETVVEKASNYEANNIRARAEADEIRRDGDERRRKDKNNPLQPSVLTPQFVNFGGNDNKGNGGGEGSINITPITNPLLNILSNSNEMLSILRKLAQLVGSAGGGSALNVTIKN